jgi:hypothetical protein
MAAKVQKLGSAVALLVDGAGHPQEPCTVERATVAGAASDKPLVKRLNDGNG